MKKRVLSFILGVSLILGSTSLSAFAASTTARLNSAKNKVTTTYTDCKGSTIVYVYGYEKHPTTKHVKYYDQQKATTDTGSYTFTHNSDKGYEFQLTYGSTKLKSKVVVTGTVMANVVVTN